MHNTAMQIASSQWTLWKWKLEELIRYNCILTTSERIASYLYLHVNNRMKTKFYVLKS